MHPLISRYLDAARALGVITDSARGKDISPEDRHLAAAASEFPDERDLLLSSGPHLDEDVQRVVLFLATHAAVRALKEDAEMGPLIERTLETLHKAGARPAEARGLVAEAVAEEAFGGEDEPDRFDRAWVKESLELLPRLLALDEDTVTALIAEHARSGGEGKGSALGRERAARALLEAAWAEGASPVNVEHVEEALDDLYEEVGEEGFEESAEALRGFITLLESRGLVGPLRGVRLRQAVDRAAHAGEGMEDDEEPLDFGDDVFGDDEPEDAELVEGDAKAEDEKDR